MLLISSEVDYTFKDLSCAKLKLTLKILSQTLSHFKRRTIMKFRRSFHRFAMAVFLAGVSTFTAVCAQAASYTNPAEGFSFDYPDGWEKRDAPNAGGAIIAVLSPRENPTDTFLENSNVVTEDTKIATITPDQYYTAAIGKLASIPNFKELKKTAVTVNGRQGVCIEATHNAGGIDAMMKQCYFNKNAKVYVLTHTGLKNSFEKYRPQFDQITNSFKVLP